MTDEDTLAKLNVEVNDFPLTLTGNMSIQDAIRSMTRRRGEAPNQDSIRALVGAMERLLRTQEDRLRKEVALDLRRLERHFGTSPGAAVNSLAVIPDSDDLGRSLELVTSLEHAVHVLHDLGLNEAQTRIVEDLIFPAVQELKELLASKGDSPESAAEKRVHSLSLVDRLVGGARGLAIAVGAVGGADEAAENIRDAAEKVIGATSRAQWLWELLFRICQSSRF